MGSSLTGYHPGRFAVDQDGDPHLNGATFYMHGGSAAAPANAVLMGAGTSAAPATSSAADAKFLEFRAQTTATSGDNRLLYMRYAMDGANSGAGGECLRAFTVMGAAVDTARGAHVSLILSTAGNTTGTGCGLQATLQVPAGTNTGALFGQIVNVWMDSASSTTMPTEHGILRLAVDGQAAQNGAVKYAINFAGVEVSAASGAVTEMVTTGCDDVASDVRLKIRINGTDYWLLATDSQPAPP